MEPSDIVLLILAVLCPPGSVALKRGLNREFIICMGLTLLFWVPGIGSTGQYHTIEDGLRRHSLTSTAGSGDDSPYRSEEDDSRSTTMTSETAAAAETAAATAAVSTQPEQSLQRHLSSGRSKKHRRARKSSRSNPSRGSTSNSRSSSALQEAARNYAMRQQQRQQSNSVKKWFVDHFYFADPTQVPPSSEREPLSNEQHELSSNR
ncbi:hypothetical protein J3B02_001399 [Coemansia erecta]|nr:hypothetical protein J3B02_001399 [Coemansia erecta]